MNIDWSKASAHATHWCPGNAKIEAGWIHHNGGGEFYSCYAEKGLEHISMFPGWRALKLIPRPKETEPWTGEGLPPVGTVCETNVDGTWEESTVLAHHREMAIVFRYSLEHEAHMYDPVGESQVRLIRTPELIAAEEREKAIAEMVYGGCGCDQSDGTTTAFVICRLLYDAGYRKQVSE